MERDADEARSARGLSSQERFPANGLEPDAAVIESAAGSDLRRQRRGENVGGVVTNEMILSELEDFLTRHFSEGAEAVLDVGAGTRPYLALYEPFFTRSASTDVASSEHDITGITEIASAE